MPLHALADGDDPNEMAKARSAVRGLERRGLVETMRRPDPDKLVPTTAIVAAVGDGFQVSYHPEPTTRQWSGMHVRIRTASTPTGDSDQGDLAARVARL